MRIAEGYGLQRMGDLTSAPIPPIRPDDHLRGDAGDPELVVMYADFSCPRCAVAAIALKDAGSSVVFRHFALRARHPRAVPLAHAAEAAGDPRGVLAVPRCAVLRPGPHRRPAPVGPLRRAGARPRPLRGRPPLRRGRSARGARPARGDAGRGDGNACVAASLGRLSRNFRIKDEETPGPPSPTRGPQEERHMSDDAVTTVTVEIAGKEISFETGQDGQAGLRRRRRPSGRHHGA